MTFEKWDKVRINFTKETLMNELISGINSDWEELKDWISTDGEVGYITRVRDGAVMVDFYDNEFWYFERDVEILND